MNFDNLRPTKPKIFEVVKDKKRARIYDDEELTLIKALENQIISLGSGSSIELFKLIQSYMVATKYNYKLLFKSTKHHSNYKFVCSCHNAKKFRKDLSEMSYSKESKEKIAKKFSSKRENKEACRFSLNIIYQNDQFKFNASSNLLHNHHPIYLKKQVNLFLSKEYRCAMINIKFDTFLIVKVLHFISKHVSDINKDDRSFTRRLIINIRDRVILEDNVLRDEKSDYAKKYKKKLFYFVYKFFYISIEYRKEYKDFSQKNVFIHLMKSLLVKRSSDYLSFESIALIKQVIGWNSCKRNMESSFLTLGDLKIPKNNINN